mmetsp:Transcript_12048/g.35468  ORF Transcript_12048/g.35468 Transcript_12048/m.35468 type:complete len:263 (-) Transcript_12048:337-1125(-)
MTHTHARMHTHTQQFAHTARLGPGWVGLQLDECLPTPNRRDSQLASKCLLPSHCRDMRRNRQQAGIVALHVRQIVGSEGAVIVVIRALRVERFDLSRQGLTTEHDLQIGQIARAKAPARIVERGVIGRRGTADAGRYHCCWACTADTPSGRVNARVGGPLDRGLRPHDHILRTTRPAVVPRRIKDEVVLAGVIHPSPAIGPPVLRQHRLHVKSVYGQSDIARASDPEGAGLVVSVWCRICCMLDAASSRHAIAAGDNECRRR